jgi:hypothetical protein
MKIIKIIVIMPFFLLSLSFMISQASSPSSARLQEILREIDHIEKSTTTHENILKSSPPQSEAISAQNALKEAVKKLKDLEKEVNELCKDK